LTTPRHIDRDRVNISGAIAMSSTNQGRFSVKTFQPLLNTKTATGKDKTHPGL
jgi:hypothetical protein